MLPPPSPPPPPPPPKPPFQIAGHAVPMTKQMRVRVGLILAAAAAAGVIALIGQQTNKTDETDTGGSTEICAFLRDPANDRLTGSDIADATDMGDVGLRRYVLSNCPELAWRI